MEVDTTAVQKQSRESVRTKPTMPQDVIIVDDDAAMCRTLARFLEQHGWGTECVHTGRLALELMRCRTPAMILLDIGLPDCNGFELLREIHLRVNVPIIVITARGEETDRIVGLELGADDYLIKPFSLRELLARMGAVKRRSRPRIVPVHVDEPFHVGKFSVDTMSKQIRYGNIKLNLSAIEFGLLRFLLERAQEISSREVLSRSVLQRSFEASDRSLDMHILRLRKKLRKLHGFGGGIRTVRNGGYMLTLQQGDKDR
jgi:two-component system response regulator CpxR